MVCQLGGGRELKHNENRLFGTSDGVIVIPRKTTWSRIVSMKPDGHSFGANPLSRTEIIRDITNMADAKANKSGRLCGEMWPSITRRYHLPICPLRWLNPTTWHHVSSVRECVCVCTCVSSMRAHCPRRDPVASLCTVLINPAMTEWIWRVVCVSPGWGERWGGGTQQRGRLPNPPKGKPQRAADPFLDRWEGGSFPDSHTAPQSRRLSVHVGPAHTETYGLMYSQMTVGSSRKETALCLISTRKCAAGDAARLLVPGTPTRVRRCKSIWALLMRIWQGADDILLPLDSKLCEICHFNDHLRSHRKPSVSWIGNVLIRNTVHWNPWKMEIFF